MSIAEKLTVIAQNEQKVYEAGKQKGWSDTWDILQNYGNKSNYTYAFYACPLLDKFYPKYDIKPTNASWMMRDGNKRDGKDLDLVERLNECGVKMDFSNCENMTYTFYNSCINHIPELDCRKAGGTIQHLLFGERVVTVDKIIIKDDGSQGLGDAFGYASALENVVIEGVIGKNNSNIGFNAKWSKKLSKSSITSLINALSPDTTGGVVTFSKKAVNTAFGINVDDLSTWGEGAEFYNLRHSKDNWTISFDDV